MKIKGTGRQKRKKYGKEARKTHRMHGKASMNAVQQRYWTAMYHLRNCKKSSCTSCDSYKEKGYRIERYR